MGVLINEPGAPFTIHDVLISTDGPAEGFIARKRFNARIMVSLTRLPVDANQVRLSTIWCSRFRKKLNT